LLSTAKGKKTATGGGGKKKEFFLAWQTKGLVRYHAGKKKKGWGDYAPDKKKGTSTKAGHGEEKNRRNPKNTSKSSRRLPDFWKGEREMFESRQAFFPTLLNRGGGGGS